MKVLLHKVLLYIDCTLRFGFKALSYKKHFVHLTVKFVFAFPKCLVVFGNGRGLLFMSFYTIIYYVNVHVCNLHNTHQKGHIENFKQHLLFFLDNGVMTNPKCQILSFVLTLEQYV